MAVSLPTFRSRRAEEARAATRHAEKVARVVDQLRSARYERPVSLRKKAVSHVVPKRNDRRYTDPKIDLSELDEILDIDVVGRRCIAEPGVTFQDLVAATLPYGLVPAVVPELRTITIGGAVSGCSLESMSFRVGGFHDSCLEYEVITAKGEVFRCTPSNEHALVFQMMHGAFGTLGILSKLEFALVPATPYVRVTYHAYATLDAYVAAIRQHGATEDVDFMDGIIHGPDKYVLCLGRFVDRAPYTHRYDWVTVYYQTTAERQEDYLRTQDYFFRYDRGVTNPTPRSVIARLLFGKLLSSASVLRAAEKLHKLLPGDRPQVTLDTFLPLSRMQEFLRWYDGQIGYYPLWCVPYRRMRDYEWIAPEVFDGVDDTLFVDLAIYGMKQPPGRNIYKELEEELLRVHGIKTLISYNYYDEDVFWTIFNKANYFAVKKITDPENLFRDLYVKTCRAARGLDDEAPVSGPRRT